MMKKVSIGPADDIPEGEGRVFSINGRAFAVFRDRGRFFAVENRCPHKGGPLADGLVGGGSVTCPLHGWQVDLESGEVVSGGTGRVETACVDVDEKGGLVVIIGEA